MRCKAEEDLNAVLRTKNTLTQEEKDDHPQLIKIIEEKEAKARKSLEEIESKRPRAIGTYVDGLQRNESIQLDNKNVQIFVDAAIAELNETEETDLKSMSHVYSPLYGFEVTQNTAMPNGEIVSWKSFVDQLRRTDSELSFNKTGRATGFTNDGRVDQAVGQLYVTILDTENTVPVDDPIASAFCHIPYKFCKDCKLSGDSLEQIRHKKMVEPMECAKCHKKLNNEEQVDPFWTRNCFVIRNYRRDFCKSGDSGALVFDEGGNAWGLVHGIFDDQTRDLLFGLASPLCLTLKALEQKSGKKELKLWRVQQATRPNNAELEKKNDISKKATELEKQVQ